MPLRTESADGFGEVGMDPIFGAPVALCFRSYTTTYRAPKSPHYKPAQAAVPL